MTEEPDVIGSRAQKLPAPAHAVWESLVAPRTTGTRAWLTLLDDEVAPRILESDEPGRVVWSSLWPARPRDVVLLEISDDARGTGCSLRFTLSTPDEPPDQSTTGHLRHRLNHLLFADLRFSYGQ